MTKKRKKLHGVVEKIIKPLYGSAYEKAQIEIKDAEPLYRELRIDNVVTDEHGHKAGLKHGAAVDVIVEADSDATIKQVS